MNDCDIHEFLALVSMAQKFMFGGSESQICVTSLLLIRQEIFHFTPPVKWLQGSETKTSPYHSRRYLQELNDLLTLFPNLPHLWSINEPGIQALTRKLFWHVSLPSSRSASFLNKLIFLASTLQLLDLLAYHVASGASLYSIAYLHLNN